MIRCLTPLLVILSLGFGEPKYIDGILVDADGIEPTPGKDFVVIKSFPSQAPSYSMGLAFDSQYLWNDDAFSYWFGQIDTASGNAIKTFNPTDGNRDMTFVGEHLWATDWQDYMVYKYDTSNGSIIFSFSPPFSGHANGMAWDGKYLWVGEEGGRIYQLDTLGTLIKSIPSPNSSNYNPRGLAFDGEYLWVGAQFDGLIYKIDTTGTVIASYSAPSGPYQQGLTYDGEYLWSTGGDGMIYKIDISPGIEGNSESGPERIFIQTNPDIFTTRTTITFGINRKGRVRLVIINSNGQLIDRVVDRFFPAGKHQINWNRSNIPAGVYFVRLEVDNRSAETKIVVVD